MSEPEELILEGAHFATRLARDVWRRYGTSASDRSIPLVSVRVRLEMFLTALFETAVTVTAMEPPAPVSWLSRLQRQRSHDRHDEALLSGTDGQRICLPPMLPPTTNGQDAMTVYRLLAVEQAARAMRGTPEMFARIDSHETGDWFLLALCRARRRACLPRRAPHLAAPRRARARDLRAPGR
jgi:nitric oxide reductase NorD protein